MNCYAKIAMPTLRVYGCESVGNISYLAKLQWLKTRKPCVCEAIRMKCCWKSPAAPCSSGNI